MKSPPDGYTLLVKAASYTVSPSAYKLSFDAMNDITPIVQLSRGPYVVAVTPSLPATTGPALADTVAGNTQMILGSVATALQHVKSGRLRALAVTTSKRIAAAPEIPTVAEAGFPTYEVTNWHGLLGPKGLPAEIVERLNREVNEALKSDEVKKILASDGLEPAGGSSAEFTPIIRSEIARWREVARQVGLKVE